MAINLETGLRPEQRGTFISMDDLHGAAGSGRTPEHLLGMTQAEYTKFLPEHIPGQVNNLINLYKRYNEMLPPMLRQRPEDLDSHGVFYLSFAVDRNRRSQETSTSEYKETVEFANSLLPADTLMVLCMDGRVKLIHTNGFSAGVGSSIRTAGGMLEGFEEGEGYLNLVEGSEFSRLLDRKMGENSTKPINENFDSHMTCAARIGEEDATGNNPESDAGLYRDVQHKRRMIEATREYLLANHPDAKRGVILTQTTFNPTTGYMYMGLETDAALRFAAEQAGDDKYAEFSKDVTRELISKEKIISTGALVGEPLIKEAFDRNSFKADWRKNYVGTAANFWKGISALKEELMPLLSERVISVYPNLARHTQLAQKELEQRCMLLLTNAFNTYLHNPTHEEERYLKMTDHEYEEEGHYPYGIHNEEGVKVSEGGHPPYDITMFVVYPGDSDSVETAARIVRTNRFNGRVKDISGLYSDDLVGFAKSPVPVVMQEIVRETDMLRVPENQWEVLRNTDWSDMPADWDAIDKTKFDEYIASKGIDSHLVAKHIHALRDKMIASYTHKKLGQHLRQLYKTVMPIICNKDRETQAVIPFVKVGRATYQNGSR